MKERIEIMVAFAAVLVVVGCLLVSEARPGSGWGALPGPEQANAAQR